MIVEQLANWRQVFHGPAWSKAFQELVACQVDRPDGNYPLQGTDIELRVMTYTTRPEAQAVLEAHREFIDIQVCLAGEERIDWYPINTVAIKDEYDAARDAAFYVPAPPAPATVHLKPGMFVVLFPNDGHAAALTPVSGEQQVKKLVIKLRVSLVEDSFTWR